MEAAASPRPSLEELVDRVFAALTFKEERDTATEAPETGAARAIHEARRLRQTGDLDGALAVLGSLDVSRAPANQVRWAFSEWKRLAKRRFGDKDAYVYSQGAGRAAALVQAAGGALEVVAVLGMRWRPGKIVSRRSLRGLRPLGGGA